MERKLLAFLVMFAALTVMMSANRVGAYASEETTAAKAVDGLTIDGDLSDWSKASPIVIEREDQVFRDERLWTGAEMMSGEIYIMWDETNLYVGADLMDDAVFQFRSMGIYASDAIELLFSTDTSANPNRTTYDSTDFRLLLATTNRDTITGIDRSMVSDPKGIETQNLLGGEGDVLTGYVKGSVEIITVPTGCTFEAKIPWSNFSNENIPLLIPQVGDGVDPAGANEGGDAFQQ